MPCSWPRLSLPRRAQFCRVNQQPFPNSTAVINGTSPYFYQWLQKAPGSTYSVISGQTSLSDFFSTTSSTTPGTWNFELNVTDSASINVNVTPSVAVIVNDVPLISQPANITYFVGDITSRYLNWTVTDTVYSGQTYTITRNFPWLRLAVGFLGLPSPWHLTWGVWLGHTITTIPAW